MKQSLMYTSPHFNCQRMVTEYMEQLYEPAHRGLQCRPTERFPACS